MNASDDVFARNLTYILDNFSSTFHKDKITINILMESWCLFVKKSNNLVSFKNGFQCSKRKFVIGPYIRVYTDFNGWDGIIEVIFRGKLFAVNI